MSYLYAVPDGSGWVLEDNDLQVGYPVIHGERVVGTIVRITDHVQPWAVRRDQGGVKLFKIATVRITDMSFASSNVGTGTMIDFRVEKTKPVKKVSRYKIALGRANE